MTLYYLASPYSKFPGGLDAAYRLACENAALLIRARIPVFSPIAHSHPIALYGSIDPLSHDIWLPADEPLMRAASGLIMLTAESWQHSYGMRVELEAFQAAGKPVHWMTPGVVPAELARLASIPSET